jgi:hypothetical protein
MSWRRKTGDSVVLSGRVIPVSATGRWGCVFASHPPSMAMSSS